MKSWTLDNLINTLSSPEPIIPQPCYSPPNRKPGPRIMMAVESMQQHMTDEGWQIAAGLKSAGYVLSGYNLPMPHVKTRVIVNRYNPSVVVLQDKREWDVRPGDFREPKARFHEVEYLNDRPDVFKLTILKDAHQRNSYHRESAEEIGCHAWIVYYHPSIICSLAPFVRPQHLIRTYHTLDASKVPDYTSQNRSLAILSGAVSRAYPLRQKLIHDMSVTRKVTYHPHPGYGRSGCQTPAYLNLLSRYKVAICTSSCYGYALRRTFEATACGCVVVTDLPLGESLPDIDDNLVRIHPNTAVPQVMDVINECGRTYCPDRQEHFAKLAKQRYDFRVEGKRLADSIEHLRRNYGQATS